MKSQITLSALAMATFLLLGGVATSQAAVQYASADSNASADHDSTDSDQPFNDTLITTKVKAELAATDAVKSTDVSVTTVNGNVTLTGVLPDKVAVQKAIAVTKSVKGVKNVDASGLKFKED